MDMVHFQHNNIAAIPIASQENMLLHDLIYCLTGMIGSHIIPENINPTDIGPIRFKISEHIHSSLRDIAMEILPLASHYSCVRKFIEKASFANCGQVLQSLSAALRALIHDYNVMRTFTYYIFPFFY